MPKSWTLQEFTMDELIKYLDEVINDLNNFVELDQGEPSPERGSYKEIKGKTYMFDGQKYVRPIGDYDRGTLDLAKKLLTIYNKKD